MVKELWDHRQNLVKFLGNFQVSNFFPGDRHDELLIFRCMSSSAAALSLYDSNEEKKQILLQNPYEILFHRTIVVASKISVFHLIFYFTATCPPSSSDFRNSEKLAVQLDEDLPLIYWCCWSPDIFFYHWMIFTILLYFLIATCIKIFLFSVLGTWDYIVGRLSNGSQSWSDHTYLNKVECVK